MYHYVDSSYNLILIYESYCDVLCLFAKETFSGFFDRISYY